jgi:pyruvate dehydrogenase E2 component (dihydrolipoamide acetyltransferase)
MPVRGTAMAQTTDAVRWPLATPLARALARDLGVDLAAVTGSGRGGRIRRADIEAAAARAVDNREQAPSGSATLPLRGAGPGTGSVQPAPAVEVPHFHLTVAVDAEALLAFQAELNRQIRAGGEGLEVRLDDLMVKACARLLAANPDLNVSFAGDRLLVHRRVHVGIAMPGPDGPAVTVVRDADRKRLTQVASEAGEPAAGDLAGATFTVSTLGGLGVERFMALIDPPQAAVLAVGAVQGELAAGDDGELAVRRRMRLTLSIDHRALDGATGAGFLAQLKELLEHPLAIVV